MSTSMDMDPTEIILNFTIENEVFQMTFGDLDAISELQKKYLTVYSVNIGAAAIAFILLWIITKNRKTPIFLFNQTALIFNLIHAALYLVYSFGPLSTITFAVTNILNADDFSAYKNTTATDVMLVLTIITIEASITYQIFIMFRSPEAKKIGLVLTTFFGMMGTAVSTLFIYSLYSSVKTYYSSEQYVMASWVSNIPYILFAASINLSSLSLTIKLFLAIRSRRYLGLKQFDSFHILFIMSTQTMIIPSTFVALNYFLSLNYNYLVSVSVFLVTLSLPLSSMWAASANNNPNPATSSSLSYILKQENSWGNESDATRLNRYYSDYAFSLFPQKVESPSMSDAESNISSNITDNSRNDAHTAKKYSSSSQIYTPTTATTTFDLFMKENDDIGVADSEIYANEVSSTRSNLIEDLVQDNFVVVTTHKLRPTQS